MKRFIRKLQIESRGKWNGHRHIPAKATAEHPEPIKQLETVTNREILREERRYLDKVAKLHERAEAAKQFVIAAEEDHESAIDGLKKVSASASRSETAYERHYHTDPVYRGWKRYVGPAVVTLIATLADAPLNYEAFARGGESDAKTIAFTVIVTGALMAGCHMVGKLLREAKSAAAVRVAGGLGLFLLSIVLAVALIRRGVLSANVSQYFPDVEPAVFFLLYLSLQLLLFAIAVILAYRTHCPWLADWERKSQAERRVARHVTRMCDRVHSRVVKKQAAVNEIRKAKLGYVSRDKQHRLAAAELHSAYIEKNRENRTDLDDSVEPLAYSLPLKLIVPPALRAIYVELGESDPRDSSAPRLTPRQEILP